MTAADCPAAAAVSGGQPTDGDELREQIARELFRWNVADDGETYEQWAFVYLAQATAVLALPAVRRLLAAEAAVKELASGYERMAGELHSLVQADVYAEVARDLRCTLADGAR